MFLDKPPCCPTWFLLGCKCCPIGCSSLPILLGCKLLPKKVLLVALLSRKSDLAFSWLQIVVFFSCAYWLIGVLLVCNNCFCRITGLQIVAKSSILPAHIGRLVALCCLTGQWAYHPPHGFSLRFHIKARLPLQICIIGGCGCDVVGGQVVGREVESRVATVERISGGYKFQPGWNSIQQN